MYCSLCSYIHHISVVRMNDDITDMACVGKTNILPGFTCIHRFVHTITITGHHTTNGMFPSAYIDHIGIAFTYGNITNGTHFKRSIADVGPLHTTIFCFPNTTACITNIIQFVVVFHTTDGIGPATTKGANVAPFDTFKYFIVIY